MTGSSPADGLDFELVAAAIRADAADLGAFLGALASKLEGAVPGQVQVRRGGGLLRRERAVSALEVSLDDRRYLLRRAGLGVDASIAHHVRGITLATEPVDLDHWIDALARHLADYASRSTRAREALRRLLT